MKRISVLIIVVAMLAACTQQPVREHAEKQRAAATNTLDTVEMVDPGSLGTRFCLNDASGKTREQIRGLAENKWGAAETSNGSGGLTTCDLGPIHVSDPSSDCPVPANVILKDNDRIRIVPSPPAVAGQPQFQVTVTDPTNGLICGKHEPLTFAAHLVGDEYASGKYKWLVSNGDVFCKDGLSQNSKYAIYVYFVDTPAVAGTPPVAIAKKYRIEFFNAAKDDCIKNAEIESHMAANANCSVADKKLPMQEPVGDGRQHRANAQGQCDYTSIAAGE